MNIGSLEKLGKKAQITWFALVLPLLLLLAAKHKAIRVGNSKHDMMVGEIFIRDADIVRYLLICKEYENECNNMKMNATR